MTDIVDGVRPSPTVKPSPQSDREQSDRPAGRWARAVGRISPRWRAVLLVFLVTKALYTALGLIYLHAHGASWTGALDRRADDAGLWDHPAFSMWFAWDSLNYVRLAEVPLGEDYPTYAWPLLYPTLGRIASFALGGNVGWGLVVVGNAALLIALYLGHRLVEEKFADPDAARRFVRYVLLMPAGFVLHAAMSESLFLCLAVAAFYLAERRRWLLVGIVGFFLALTRSVGFLAVLPLALMVLQQQRYRFDRAALLAYLRDLPPLALVPGGWLAFMGLCKWQTGDFHAYERVQYKEHSFHTQNPLVTVYDTVMDGSVNDRNRLLFAVVALVVAVVAARRIGLPYTMWVLLMVAVPMSISDGVYKSLIRYLVVLFPLALALALWTRRREVDTYLTAALVAVQTLVFALWMNAGLQFMI